MNISSLSPFTPADPVGSESFKLEAGKSYEISVMPTVVHSVEKVAEMETANKQCQSYDQSHLEFFKYYTQVSPSF